MLRISRQPALKELKKIPGIGDKMADELWKLGIHSVSELKNQDPEALYRLICTRKGVHVDRCVLYVFRCAVYYASNKKHDPALLKWWNWKDDRSSGVRIDKLRRRKSR